MNVMHVRMICRISRVISCGKMLGIGDGSLAVETIIIRRDFDIMLP